MVAAGRDQVGARRAMIVHGDVETELLRVWTLISELSDQLQENRDVTADLRAQAEALKTKAVHSGTGYPLRRFNMDLSKEGFEEELEKLNSQFVMENQSLANDNKQLAVLVKEYEQTLENVMSKFRVHAHASQEHELALTRQYEQRLLMRESAAISHELEETAKISVGLAKISQWLRLALRANGGEASLPSTYSWAEDGSLVETSPDVVALERECELVRLEKENEELRALLDLRDRKETASLREEIAQETREAYERRAGGQSDSLFMSHNMDSDLRGPRMFSPTGLRGANRGKRAGISRGKPRMYGVQHATAW